MPNLLIALVIVVGGWWMLRTLGQAQPAQVRGLMRKGAGAAIIGASVLFAMRGGLQIAAPLFLLGLGMFTDVSSVLKSGAFWKKPPGQSSRVATSILEMELNHDTGVMDGTVLAGPMRGRRLSTLQPSEIEMVRQSCEAAADQSLQLFDAWVRRAHPEYRPHGPGSGSAEIGGSGKMSRKEALAILGLADGASPNDIKTAHRNLMKQFHPDRGGTDYLAAKINQAKDTLL